MNPKSVSVATVLAGASSLTGPGLLRCGTSIARSPITGSWLSVRLLPEAEAGLMEWNGTPRGYRWPVSFYSQLTKNLAYIRGLIPVAVWRIADLLASRGWFFVGATAREHVVGLGI